MKSNTRVRISTPSSKKRRIELQKLADYHLLRIKRETSFTPIVFKRNKLTGEVCYY